MVAWSALARGVGSARNISVRGLRPVIGLGEFGSRSFSKKTDGKDNKGKDNANNTKFPNKGATEVAKTGSVPYFGNSKAAGSVPSFGNSQVKTKVTTQPTSAARSQNIRGGPPTFHYQEDSDSDEDFEDISDDDDDSDEDWENRDDIDLDPVPAEYNFGINLFNAEEECSFEVAAALKASIRDNAAMKKEHADELAEAMMLWAMDRGATSFAHWASPMRGPNNLLKNDMFIDLDFSTMQPITKFGGSKLFFNETDGSSFPNGGLRATHTAAGYLTWDKMSPPFIRNNTLYIPSAFISWNGHALDEKVPLLRSQVAVDKAGLRLLKHLGDKKATGVTCNVGWEQEFFLIDREMYLERPDLVMCGRTLFGAPPPRGQQTDQNYFSRMPPRVKQVLEDCRKELHHCNVPLMVYHNEVAPSQFEFSPIFSMVNQAADTNVLAMDCLQECANRHGMVALFHEKPFAGLNGSGKHSNWGLNETSTGRNLFVPGKTVEEQRSFIALTACLMRAVHKHGDLIRCSVASAGNDFRLGAQEAPPAIISLYLGPLLGEHVEKFVNGHGKMEGYGKVEKFVSHGSPFVQPVKAAAEDRNRTAPFPFCGNRFEFRAVGSDFHIGFPLTVVQTAFAEAASEMADELDKGKRLDDVVRSVFKQSLPAMFNGNGYSEEWQVESSKRGLHNLKNTPTALATMVSEKNEKLFSEQKVYSKEELHARQDIMLHKYVKVNLIEANCLVDMMETGVLPACAADLQRYSGAMSLAGDRQSLYQALRLTVDALSDLIDKFPYDASEQEQADHCNNVIKPAMMQVRIECDQAERSVARELWPYPNYQEILFNHHTQSRNVESRNVGRVD